MTDKKCLWKIAPAPFEVLPKSKVCRKWPDLCVQTWSFPFIVNAIRKFCVGQIFAIASDWTKRTVSSSGPLGRGRKTNWHRPELNVQTRISPDSSHDIIQDFESGPSSPKFRVLIGYKWPLNKWFVLPSEVEMTLTVPSIDPVTIKLLSARRTTFNAWEWPDFTEKVFSKFESRRITCISIEKQMTSSSSSNKCVIPLKIRIRANGHLIRSLVGGHMTYLGAT